MLNEIFLRNKNSTILNTLKALRICIHLAYKAQSQNIPFMKHRRAYNYYLNITKFSKIQHEKYQPEVNNRY